MISKILSRLLGGVLLLSAAPPALASNFDEMNSTLYLKTQHPIHLYLATQLKNGERTLAAHLRAPEDSILAIDVENIDAALTLNRNSPERVKYPFIPAGQNRIQKPQNGWVCGFRIVDALDEEVRSSDFFDREDFCVSLNEVKRTSLLPSNADEITEAFRVYQKTGNLTYMNALANYVDRIRKDREESGLVEKGVGQTLISPIKNCGQGCLVATSEYEVRMHPVLKRKRLHKGIDLRAAIGTPVVSTLDGKVLAVRTEKNPATRKISGYGHYVIVVHPENKMETLYAHLSAFKMKTGAEVKQGDLIALSGDTGIGTAAHLHFETHVQGKKGFVTVNPRIFLSSILTSLASLLRTFDMSV